MNTRVMNRLLLSFALLLGVTLSYAQTVNVSYAFDERTGVHIVSLPESIPHDYMLQKIVYDLQFQRTKTGRLYLSVNIGQTGYTSEAMNLVGMYQEPLQSVVHLLFQDKEWLTVRSAIVKGEKIVMENGDTLALLSLLLPLDSFTSSIKGTQGKTPEEISSYLIDRLLKCNMQKLVFANKDFYMNYLNTSLIIKPLLVALSQNTDIVLPDDIGVSPTASNSSYKRKVIVNVNNYNQYKSLRETIQKTGRCRLATLTTNYGGSMVYGPNGYFSSGRTPSDLTTYLRLINSSKKKIEEINIAENGAFVVVYDYYEFFHQGLPDKLVEVLSSVGKQDLVYSACFNLKGEWAVVTKRNCYASAGIQKHIDDAKDQYGKPRHCFFTENGISIICARGVYTHNVPQTLLDGLDVLNWKPTAIKFTDSGYFIISNDSEKCYFNL